MTQYYYDNLFLQSREYASVRHFIQLFISVLPPKILFINYMCVDFLTISMFYKS